MCRRKDGGQCESEGDAGHRIGPRFHCHPESTHVLANGLKHIPTALGMQLNLGEPCLKPRKARYHLSRNRFTSVVSTTTNSCVIAMSFYSSKHTGDVRKNLNERYRYSPE